MSKSQSGSGGDQGRRATPSSATPSTTAATRPIHRCRPGGKQPNLSGPSAWMGMTLTPSGRTYP